MRRRILLLFVISTLPAISNAQTDYNDNPPTYNTTDTAKHQADTIKGKLHVAFLASGGVVFFSLEVPDYTKYLISTGGGVPVSLTYSNISIWPYVSAGADIRSSKVKWLDNIFEISYTAFKGVYSYSGPNPISSGFGQSTITAGQGNYLNNVISIRYAFQPRIKFFFVSIGAGLDINKGYLNETRNEVGYNYPPEQTPVPFNYADNIKKSIAYQSFPIRLGAGACMHVKKLEFRIGAYDNYYFNHGYNAFGFTVTVLHIPKGF
jgi:hypothetical protein